MITKIEECFRILLVQMLVLFANMDWIPKLELRTQNTGWNVDIRAVFNKG